MNVTSFENRVIELCSRAVKAEDDEEVRRLAAELRQILHERIEQLRRRLAFTSIASALAPDRSERHQKDGTSFS
jgi:biopolymer transport protein ExbB/TolQ